MTLPIFILCVLSPIWVPALVFGLVVLHFICTAIWVPALVFGLVVLHFICTAK